MVTPRIEGILQIVGVKWKLSGSVVGFHKFDTNPMKKISRKRIQKAKHPHSDNLKFVVVKGFAPTSYSFHLQNSAMTMFGHPFLLTIFFPMSECTQA